MIIMDTLKTASASLALLVVPGRAERVERNMVRNGFDRQDPSRLSVRHVAMANKLIYCSIAGAAFSRLALKHAFFGASSNDRLKTAFVWCIATACCSALFGLVRCLQSRYYAIDTMDKRTENKRLEDDLSGHHRLASPRVRNARNQEKVLSRSRLALRHVSSATKVLLCSVVGAAFSYLALKHSFFDASSNDRLKTAFVCCRAITCCSAFFGFVRLSQANRYVLEDMPKTTLVR